MTECLALHDPGVRRTAGRAGTRVLRPYRPHASSRTRDAAWEERW